MIRCSYGFQFYRELLCSPGCSVDIVHFLVSVAIRLLSIVFDLIFLLIILIIQCKDASSVASSRCFFSFVTDKIIQSAILTILSLHTRT